MPMCTRPAFFLGGEARKRAEESYRLCLEAKTSRVQSRTDRVESRTDRTTTRQEERSERTDTRAEARVAVAEETGTTPEIEFVRGLSDLYNAAGEVGAAYLSGGLSELGGSAPAAPPPPPPATSSLPDWALPAGAALVAGGLIYALTR